MTKQELTDALAWMQELQARVAFDKKVTINVDVQFTPSNDEPDNMAGWSLHLDIWTRNNDVYKRFAACGYLEAIFWDREKDKCLAYLEQFGIKPYAA